MTRSYTMRGVQGTADRAVKLATAVLRWQVPDGLVHDVQADPRFQHRGVDLLWQCPGQQVQGVEVKGDRNARRGNYFLELISNYEKNTPGCFLYSDADVLAYVFLETRQVHLLPMPATREWFLAREEKFPLRHTQTRMGPLRYTTVGAIVPCKTLRKEVAGLQRFHVDAEGAIHPLDA